jgi:hypothetical protein
MHRASHRQHMRHSAEYALTHWMLYEGGRRAQIICYGMIPLDH